MAGWAAGGQSGECCAFFLSFLDYITLPATFKTIRLNGFRQYVCKGVCRLPISHPMCLLLSQVVQVVSVTVSRSLIGLRCHAACIII